MSGGLFDDLPPPKCSENKEEEKSNSNTDTELNTNGTTMRKRKFLDSDCLCTVSLCEISRYEHSITEYQGDREEMQDFHIAIDQCIDHPLINNDKLKENFKIIAMYAIFDGHGGKAASKYASENFHIQFFHNFLLKSGSTFNKDINTKICETFKVIDDNFLKLAKISNPPKKDGTTALTLFIFENSVYIANLGDCRCAVVYKCDQINNFENYTTKVSSNDKKCNRRNLMLKFLNDIHSPNNRDERERIEKCGGFVRDGRVMGIMEVSRSIGDINFKKGGIVNSTPTVSKYTIDHNDVCIIMGCDGFWNNISTNEILNCLESHDIDKVDSNDKKKLKVVTNQLCKISFENGSNDNISVIIIRPIFE